MEKTCLSSVLWLILLYSFISAVHCDCGQPQNIPYAILKPEFAVKMHFAVGSTVKYDCQPGFIRTPGSKNYITCYKDSSWSSYDEFCQLRSCGYPGDIENGYLETESFFFGSKVTFHCNLGFNMVSKRNSRECQADGTWSNTLPSCEVVMCPPPPTIPNGIFSPVKEEYEFADAVRYKCTSPNMVTEYDSSVFCMDNGNWSDPLPRCIEVNCEPPEIPHSRKMLGFVGPYTLNSVMRFECNKGFAMEGTDTIVCNIHSEWDPSPPECIGAFCPEPKLLNGKVKRGKKTDGYSVGNSVTLECDLNYKLNGESKVTCGEDFQWYPHLPTCELGTFCPEPKLINGKIIQGKKTYGYYECDSITVACNSGYKLNGEKRVKCQGDFQWSEFPICELKKGCRSPQIANGHITQKNGIRYDPEIDGHGFSTSDEVEIVCDKGYRLQGSSQSTCIEKRTWYYFDFNYLWSPELPTCI
ncbi:C4b-binding protein alpha chain-like isoform X1 [Rana temporaria]|uniref:C4b-binding protein alpha chain-like isoform X1 n=1 Tax=Rana temporaria TaxID=8407 RepID=UPI001AACC653|nr:C4b-binding protein alpha chain-like isoform X1 [Rana temporaria]